MKSGKIAGILGLIGVFIFIAAATLSVLMFEDGVYSPANCFITELGLYTGGFMAASSAFIFNIGLVFSGALLSALMILYGIRNESRLNTAVSFFGVLSGILMAAQGLFSLNFASLHFALSAAFYISAFIMCVLFIISERFYKRAFSISVITAELAAITSIGSAVFILTGGIAQIFAEDAAGAARQYYIPFAAVSWGTYFLLFAFFLILALKMLRDSTVEKSSDK